jgi:hypothetical protein
VANYKAPDLRNRAPKVETLPDLRQRITRVYDILGEVPKFQTAGTTQPGVSAYTLPWGSADSVPPSEGSSYSNCLLIKQTIEGQFELNGPGDNPNTIFPTLTRVYEQISATGETKVGDDDTTIDQDGLVEVTQHFLQFSVSVSGITPTFLTPGTSSITSEPGATCVLKEEIRTDDGTLQRIERHYISKGEISQTITDKFNGALVLTTLVYVNEVPPTPSGAVLIDAKVDHPNGNALYQYTFAKGLGQISLQTEYRLSPDQGTTGVTVQTIRYIAAPGSSNPISTPGGYEEISISYEEQDGYRLWSGIYSFGQGTIATEVEIRLNDKLQITTITAINSAPSAPSPAIGGTLALISTDVRNGTRFEDGTVIYTYKWAESAGGSTGAQISVDTEYLQSVDTGTNGVTRTTYRYIVSAGATIQPTSGPSGTVLVSKSYEDAEGYGFWKTVWVKGAGTVFSEVDTVETGALVRYRIVGLGTAPSTPSATIGGTVVLVESEVRNENGWLVYDYRWAEGNGQTNITTRGESDGALLYEVTTNTAAASTPAYPGSGTAYLIDLQQTQGPGYVVNRATYKKPPTGIALLRRIKFSMPGQIELTSPNPGWVFVPPVNMDILATQTYTYPTTQVSTTPFTIKAWAAINYGYTPVGSSVGVGGQQGCTGYLSGATGGSGGSATFNNIPVSAYSYTIAGSTPSSPPSGPTPIDVENRVYLVSTAGTIVYESIVTTYSF